MLQVEPWRPGWVLLGRMLHGSATQRRDVGRKAVAAYMTTLQVSGLSCALHAIRWQFLPSRACKVACLLLDILFLHFKLYQQPLSVQR